VHSPGGRVRRARLADACTTVDSRLDRPTMLARQRTPLTCSSSQCSSEPPTRSQALWAASTRESLWVASAATAALSPKRQACTPRLPRDTATTIELDRRRKERLQTGSSHLSGDWRVRMRGDEDLSGQTTTCRWPRGKPRENQPEGDGRLTSQPTNDLPDTTNHSTHHPASSIQVGASVTPVEQSWQSR